MRAALLSLLVCSTSVAAAANQALTTEQYGDRLRHLQQVTTACADAIETKSCSEDAIGADPTVRIGNLERSVDLSWLRDTVASAAKRGQTAEEREAAKARLRAAADRLTEELANVHGRSAAGQLAIQQQTARTAPVLRSVLATGEFGHVQQPSLLSRLFDRFVRWMLRALGRAASAGQVSPWAVRIVSAAILLLALAVLGLWYARQVSRRFAMPNQSVDENGREPGDAPRWQRLLAQAESLAASQEWREAVHLLYWAAIARLESLGRWPGDRARTPREYLRLMPASSRRDDLVSLTRALERFWYGSQPAHEDDFQAARLAFDRLADA